MFLTTAGNVFCLLRKEKFPFDSQSSSEPITRQWSQGFDILLFRVRSRVRDRLNGMSLVCHYQLSS